MDLKETFDNVTGKSKVLQQCALAGARPTPDNIKTAIERIIGVSDDAPWSLTMSLASTTMRAYDHDLHQTSSSIRGAASSVDRMSIQFDKKTKRWDTAQTQSQVLATQLSSDPAAEHDMKLVDNLMQKAAELVALLPPSSELDELRSTYEAMLCIVQALAYRSGKRVEQARNLNRQALLSALVNSSRSLTSDGIVNAVLQDGDIGMLALLDVLEVSLPADQRKTIARIFSSMPLTGVVHTDLDTFVKTIETEVGLDAIHELQRVGMIARVGREDEKNTLREL